jgi:hypothetical protein
MPHVDGVNDGVGYGVKGENTTAVVIGNHEPGIIGTSQTGVGVFGTAGDISSFGVFGNAGTGVQGVSPDGAGVSGLSSTGPGVSGESKTGIGVHGLGGKFAGQFDGNVLINGLLNVSNTVTAAGLITSETANITKELSVGTVAVNVIRGTGLSGVAINGDVQVTGALHVQAASVTEDAIQGTSAAPTHAGVSAINTAGGFGVWAQATTAGFFDGEVQVTGALHVQAASVTEDAIQGTSAAPTHAGVSAVNTAGGFGVWAQAKTAGFFDGDVQVTGNLNMTGANSDIIITGGDCAEDFDIGLNTNLEPGTVMALDENGLLQESRHAYDKKVAGVISGAGEYKPGLILGRDKVHGDCRRAPVALVGKVYCKVDAQHAPIEIGDLLTTSPTPGHAMKAQDSIRAFGAVIGKALRSLKSGRALVPILVALQ